MSEAANILTEVGERSRRSRRRRTVRSGRAPIATSILPPARSSPAGSQSNGEIRPFGSVDNISIDVCERTSASPYGDGPRCELVLASNIDFERPCREAASRHVVVERLLADRRLLRRVRGSFDGEGRVISKLRSTCRRRTMSRLFDIPTAGSALEQRQLAGRNRCGRVASASWPGPSTRTINNASATGAVAAGITAADWQANPG